MFGIWGLEFGVWGFQLSNSLRVYGTKSFGIWGGGKANAGYNKVVYLFIEGFIYL